MSVTKNSVYFMKKNSIKSSNFFNVLTIEENSTISANEDIKPSQPEVKTYSPQILENKWCNRRSLIALVLIIVLAIALIVYMSGLSLSSETRQSTRTETKKLFPTLNRVSPRIIVSRYDTPRHVYYSNGKAWYRDAPFPEQYNRPRCLPSQTRNYQPNCHSCP